MDPLSIIGSAVGIVSLGIQISGGLISYVGDVKNEKFEVTSICNQIEELGRTIEDLEKVVQPANATTSLVDPALARATQTCNTVL